MLRTLGKESTMLITRTRRFTTLGLALLFAICMFSSGFAHDHGFTTIDVPGASSTEAFGINPEGNVVGVYSNATGTHGFLLRRRERDDDGDNDTFTTIDVPGASVTEAFGINPEGNVVGLYRNATGIHGFILRRRERDDDGDNDAFTTIDVPGASFTEAFGINPEGNVVGLYRNATGTHGFLLRRRERDEDGDKKDANGPRNTERSVSRITLAARGESP